jgi:hypothetical protein
MLCHGVPVDVCDQDRHRRCWGCGAGVGVGGDCPAVCSLPWTTLHCTVLRCCSLFCTALLSLLLTTLHCSTHTTHTAYRTALALAAAAGHVAVSELLVQNGTEIGVVAGGAAAVVVVMEVLIAVAVVSIRNTSYICSVASGNSAVCCRCSCMACRQVLVPVG